jgi:hypothetical protein
MGAGRAESRPWAPSSILAHEARLKGAARGRPVSLGAGRANKASAGFPLPRSDSRNRTRSGRTTHFGKGPVDADTGHSPTASGNGSSRPEGDL